MEEQKSWKGIKILLLILGILVIFLLYSHYVEPHTLKTVETKIVSSKITDTFHGLKLVQISDLHYGSTTTSKDLEKIKKEVNRLKADILVFTGDLIESNVELTSEQNEELTTFLSGLEATISKYAISGEEDVVRENYSILLENGGFTLLDEKYDTIYNENYEFILIAGVSSKDKEGENKVSSTLEYVNSLEEKPTYQILLLHEPDLVEELDISNFDLILGGHSHFGQIQLPFIGGLCYPSNSKNHKNRHYTLGNTEVYISGGLGTTKIPFRFLNTPEINLYRLTNK